jgi:predicted secreted acid phosphatase
VFENCSVEPVFEGLEHVIKSRGEMMYSSSRTQQQPQPTTAQYLLKGNTTSVFTSRPYLLQQTSRETTEPNGRKHLKISAHAKQQNPLSVPELDMGYGNLLHPFASQQIPPNSIQITQYP